MTTPILGIKEMTGSQLNQYITANEAVRALEASGNDFFVVDLSALDVTLTAEQFCGAVYFISSGNAVARSMIVPQSKRAFYVKNSGTFDLTVSRGTSNIILAVNEAGLFYTDGTPNGISKIGGGSGGVTGFTSGTNSTSPNDTVPAVYLAPDDPSANVDIVLAIKGAGALCLDVPDGTAAGGNKRGANAIDLQSVRSTASQVASGGGSINIGQYCTASGPQSISVGYECLGSGYYDIAIGGTCTATGNYGVSIGYSNDVTASFAAAIGANSVASAEASMAIGRFAITGPIIGNHVESNGRFSSAGDSQKGTLIYRRGTSDDTPTVLTTNDSGGSATNQKTLLDNSTVAFHGKITGRHASSGDCACWEFSGSIKRGAGAGTTAMLSAVTPVSIGADSGASSWLVGVSADTTNGCLRIEVTGETGKSIRWMCVLESGDLVW